MKHAHRLWHRRIWPVLVLLVALGLVLALTRRAPAAPVVEAVVERSR